MLIVGSGNVVHNLRRIDWSRPDAGVRLGPALRRGRARRIMTTRPAGRGGARASTPTSRSPCPTPDHFIPLLYLAGLAAAAGETADVLVDGYAMGSLSMTSYTLDATVDPNGRDGGSPPLPSTPPADETNA